MEEAFSKKIVLIEKRNDARIAQLKAEIDAQFNSFEERFNSMVSK
jgi:hypothetical protein